MYIFDIYDDAKLHFLSMRTYFAVYHIRDMQAFIRTDKCIIVLRHSFEFVYTLFRSIDIRR